MRIFPAHGTQVTPAVEAAGAFMFWQRRLPHLVPEGSTVFVTWRLAGTMPQPKLDRNPDPGKVFLLHDRELDRTRSGPQWLKDTRIADCFVEALLYGADVRNSYELFAWVVMPNHVHLVLRPHEPLPDIVKWLKTSTATRSNQLLGRTGQPFWRREYYDHWVRDTKELNSVIHYVERNPVKASLTKCPEDWPWSSAKGTGGFDRRRYRVATE